MATPYDLQSKEHQILKYHTEIYLSHKPRQKSHGDLIFLYEFVYNPYNL